MAALKAEILGLQERVDKIEPTLKVVQLMLKDLGRGRDPSDDPNYSKYKEFQQVTLEEERASKEPTSRVTVGGNLAKGLVSTSQSFDKGDSL